MAPTTGRTGRPPVTSRADILTAARQLIDREGWQKLTIRRLAAEAGIAPTTLYHHVRDKDDLLVQLLNHYADRIPRPALPGNPRERITVAAISMHDALAAWPWVVEVLTADDLLGESALWMVEAIVGGAVDCGCTPEQAVVFYRSVWYYTIGEIMVRAAAARRRTDDRPIVRDAVFASLDPDALPHLAALGARWPELTSGETYPLGLRGLMDGLLPRP